MDNVNYILFLCVTIPLLLMLFLTDRDHRTGLTFMVIGIVLCLIVSELNGFFLRLFGGDLLYVTTTVTPITEELVKALPVLFFALLISDDSKTLVTVSMAVGIGFAVLENLIILVGNVENVTLSWAFVRGLSSGLMHGVCTALVGMGMSMVRKRRKLFLPGTFALLSTAIIYHAIFNMLVQSPYKYTGFLLPMFTYLPLLIVTLRRRRRAAKAGKPGA